MLRTARSLPLHRAFDAGLRPDPFPDRTASLLPGLLAATRTGLTPAGDDELTNLGHLHKVTSVLLGARTIRVKDRSSFLEKIDRKGYKSPFEETDDLVGARVVCLFRSDLERLKQIVNSSFTVLKHEDKVDGESADSFG